MAESVMDLVMHPIRMRIVLAMVSARHLTAQQIAAALSDVPPATLYRHLNKLAGAGLLVVVEERRVRGAVERTYALPEQGVQLGPEEFAKLTREDHLRYFTTFLASLLGDFSRYLQQEKIDFLKDGVGYHQVPVYLSDAELQQFSIALNQALAPYIGNEPGEERRQRLLSTIMMPAPALPQP